MQSGTADAVVAVAGESEIGQLLAQVLDAVETIEMSDGLLRDGRLPFVDAAEEWLGLQSQNLLQFVADDSNNLIVGESPDIFRILSSKKASQQGAVFRSAIGEFVVHKSCRQQSLPSLRGTRNPKPGERDLADISIVA